MPFGIGIWEVMILGLVVLLVFGPKRLPEMGRSLGKGMREFKESISSTTDAFNLEQQDEPPRVESERDERSAKEHRPAA